MTHKSEHRLDVDPTVRELRRSLRDAIADHRSTEAVEHCRQILHHQPDDRAAFVLLESHYRRTAQHAQLLELLRESAQPPELSLAERRSRLREVAWLNERKLRDTDAAITAWQGVLAVDPNDDEALRALHRLLRRTEQWSELAHMLEREASTVEAPAARAARLDQLATLQRQQCNDPYRAADTLRELFVLRPDASTRRRLCDALLETHAYADAVPLLRQQADEAGDKERLSLLRKLANLLETKLQEPESAFEVCQQILALRPDDQETLDRMQRMDERSGNAERLLSTLMLQSKRLPRQERASLYIEMAKLAEEAINDIERAGEYYREAYQLDPSRAGTLDALCALFECRELDVRLAEILEEMQDAVRDPERRVELGLRRARLLAGTMGASASAAQAYREVLRSEENVEALRYLLQLSREQHDADTTASLCARLAALLEDRIECRGLLYERAQLLVTELGRPRDAVVTLRNIVEEVDPDYEPAIEWLAELAGNLGDNRGVASALWRRLAKSSTQDARVALARRLSDLHEHDLDDKDQAVEALTCWVQADPVDVVPQRRLRRLLEENGQYQALVTACDALAELEPDPNTRDEATLRAAQVCAMQLRAPDAAWQRLAPLVARGQAKAIELLTTIARQNQRLEDLAALYERSALETTQNELQKLLWAQATRTYRDELGRPERALDTALHLLDADSRDRDALAQVEESVTQSGLWDRLSNVYERLLQAAANDTERTQLLMRYADLLERRANQPDQALDLVLQACAIAPDDELLVSQSERLALSCDRSADLLGLCDQQAAAASDPRVQVEWLLRGARFASSAAEDRGATYAYLEHALAAARTDGPLWEQCVALAQRLDARTPDSDHHSHLLALVAAHRRVAERSPAPVGVSLMRRASRLVEEKLGDDRAAFDLLRAGATLFPLDENMYDSLLERAEATGHLDALDAHLARGVDEALDPRTAATLLSRRARLLEGPLGRPDDAANVYSKLLQLRPDDQQAASKLRDSLRRARRFQDLLVVIHKQTLRAKQPHEKVELLKETAQVWELDLRNRWEAVDAWGKVLELAPEDAEAQRAMTRLNRRGLQPSLPPHLSQRPSLNATARQDPGSIRPRTSVASLAPPQAPPSAAPASAKEPGALPSVPVTTLELGGRAHSQEPDEDEDELLELVALDESELEVISETEEPAQRRSTPPPPPPPAPQSTLLSGRPKPPQTSGPPPPPLPPPAKPRSD